MSAGKGDSPRNCFSKEFKKNYDQINWHNKWCKKCKIFTNHTEINCKIKKEK